MNVRTTAGSAENKIVAFLINHNRKQSETFTSPDTEGARRLYRLNQSTEFAALKCMDGRLNLAVITGTPPGIFQPFRNIGGKFDLGWPYFGKVFENWVDRSLEQRRRCLALVTYHYSKGDRHRGCAGHKYDAAAARACAFDLGKQIERVYCRNHTVVTPIVVGIETDEDALVLHDAAGQTLELAKMRTDDQGFANRVERLFPNMHAEMLVDFLTILKGNLAHIAQIRASRRPITETVHREQVLAVGRGFDWLHLPNTAIIVGPYSYNLGDPIATAGELLLDNIMSERIPPENGVILFSSATYRSSSTFDRLKAEEKAMSLARFSLETLVQRVPKLRGFLLVLAGVVNQDTRLLTPLSFEA